MLALLNEPQGLSRRQNISMSSFMKAAGRPASGLMCIAMPTSRGFHRRREWMPVTRTLQPVVEALAATGEINSKLIWSNTGYLINWYLGKCARCW